MRVTPDYATPQVTPLPGVVNYRLAVACAVAPTVVGVSILLLYLVTEWEALVVAGMFTLAGGAVAVVLACSFAASYWVMSRDGDPAVRRTVRRRLWLVAGLVVLNLPAGWVCVVVGSGRAAEAMTRYSVTVTNAGSTPVAGVLLRGPGVSVDTGPIAPGRSVRHVLTFSGDGHLTYSVTAAAGAPPVTGVADGYVTLGMGGKRIVTVNGSTVAVSP